MCALADRCFVLLRLDVDDDVAAGQHVVQRLLHPVGSRVALADGRARRHRDHDVRELAAARLPHPQTSQRHGGLDPCNRNPRRVLRIGRRTIHQHVDVSLHQSCCGEEHERGDEQRGCRVCARVSRTHEQQPEQHRAGAREVAAEMQCVRGESLTQVTA